MPFGCGCYAEGEERCEEHTDFRCHTSGLDPDDSSLLCPPCRLAVRRSVILDHQATPTRKWSL